MREVVLDTETTGLVPSEGHRIVEIGCVELFNHVPTGNVWHSYVNPDRDMPLQAFQVHGLSEEFLAEHPLFTEVVGEFLEFIGDDPLVIHNAEFDIGFINSELARLGFPRLPIDRAVDTVRLARQRYPGAQASLDALCRRFGIDLSARGKHGALLDAELLAEVYLELVGGRQPGFGLVDADVDAGTAAAARRRPARPPRAHRPNEAEIAAHRALLAKLRDPIWDS